MKMRKYGASPELTVGISVMFGLWTRSSALAALMLFLSFAVALGINIHRGAELSCGCFALDGTGGSLHQALLRDVLPISIAILFVFVRRVPFSLEDFIYRRQSTRSPIASSRACG